MGIYLNPGSEGFYESIASEIYVDKTGLIGFTNQVLRTKQKFICVSRPRRFGKYMAAEMLAAYYQRGIDSRELFEGLAISREESYEANLNQYNVIFLNVQEFLSQNADIESLKNEIEKVLFLKRRNAGMMAIVLKT